MLGLLKCVTCVMILICDSTRSCVIKKGSTAGQLHAKMKARVLGCDLQTCCPQLHGEADNATGQVL